MTPKQFLRIFKYDDRLTRGGYYPSDDLKVERGCRVGVVLLNLGGPAEAAEVERYCYRLYMDPALMDLRVGGILRHALCRLMAKMRAKEARRHYEAIGGASPLTNLIADQADVLERRLNSQYAPVLGVQFKVYPAMRHAQPSYEDVARQLDADQIDRVLLMPLYPQHARVTSGAALAYWWTLEQQQAISVRPTMQVRAFADHPKYIKALSERIDEALQRYPRTIRPKVHLLFTAQSTPASDLKRRKDPYRGLVRETVRQVMTLRKHDLSHSMSFHGQLGFAEMLTPRTTDVLVRLGEERRSAVLVVPVSFVTDMVETVYAMDVTLREQARAQDIRHYEVTSGLNCHPLFIEALAEMAGEMLTAQCLENGTPDAEAEKGSARASRRARTAPDTRRGTRPKPDVSNES